jgi:hypothetical protein
MTDTISIDDDGTDLQVTITESGVAVDISAATAYAVILKDPDGIETEKTAAVLNDGTDGIIHYVLTVADKNGKVGEWSYKGKVTFSPTQIFHSIDPEVFEVV